MRSSLRTPPAWLWALLGVDGPPSEGDRIDLGGKDYVLEEGILRAGSVSSRRQAQTADTFGYKWQQVETFERDEALARTRDWLLERYGDVIGEPWWADYGKAPVLLDAGCGAAMSSLLLFGSFLSELRYVGADISAAVDVGAARCAEHGVSGAFIQDDLMSLPFAAGSVHVIFSEGALHHTDSTREAIRRLSRLLAPGGRFLFYVYRRKGPIREFTDDYVRGLLQDMDPEGAWKAVEPLTRLGIALGELGAEVEVPDDIALLQIPAGRYDLQRLFYWHVAKVFHHPDLTFDELNCINYDWYAPANAHRQTPEEVRNWCETAGLTIDREHVEDAGITVIARRET